VAPRPSNSRRRAPRPASHTRAVPTPRTQPTAGSTRSRRPGPDPRWADLEPGYDDRDDEAARAGHHGHREQTEATAARPGQRKHGEKADRQEAHRLEQHVHRQGEEHRADAGSGPEVEEAGPGNSRASSRCESRGRVPSSRSGQAEPPSAPGGCHERRMSLSVTLYLAPRCLRHPKLLYFPLDVRRRLA
jgi:hypothetical protein